MSNFNTTAFLEDAKRIHLKVGDTLPDLNIKERIDEVIDYDKSLFSMALDEICKNIVGNTMFRLLVSKKPPGRRLRIVDIGPEQTGKLLSKQKGSSYKNYSVKINSNVYSRDGVGIPERQYYCVDERDNVSLKMKSLSASLFHEFTHFLHHVEDRRRYSEYSAENSLPDGDIWHTKEERRTISGYIDPGIYDPICDNCFRLYDSLVSGKLYTPRIGHCGYRSNRADQDEENRTKLSAYLPTPEAKEIIENFQKYVLE
jgi:hypothetical protein